MTKASTLEIKDLHASVDGKQILKGVNLIIKKGEVHALMGPNGSGKSTLSAILMGHPKYTIDSGSILLDGEDITELEPAERARKGLFLAFQYPMEIPGVNYFHFLFTAYKALTKQEKLSPLQFKKHVLAKLPLLDLKPAFLERSLNAGFSGGEKKRAEILQMALFEPSIAVLDETDSGLDIDSLKIVSAAINSMRGPDFGALVITHYQRILHHLKPDVVHVMKAGRIVRTGDSTLAAELEKTGYEQVVEAAQ